MARPHTRIKHRIVFVLGVNVLAQYNVLRYTFKIRDFFQDDINGAVVQRAEKREEGSVTGEYSYSDGFFKRTGE